MIKKKNTKLAANFLVLLTLFIMILPGVGQDTGSIISGYVKDSDGNAIVGASVSIFEELKHSYTNEEGKFVFESSPGVVLYISKMGYAPSSVKVEYNSGELLVVLEKTEEEEYVDVAYGERSKLGSTHSISTINAESLEKSSVPNLSNAIAGRAAGLTVIRNSGDEPGYDNSSIYVRGIGTFSSSRSPLVMVDNVVRDYSMLDPMEIESFSILKDAAATVMYGMRGANGAINIKTKRGFTGKPEITFIAQSGIQSPTRLPDYLGSEEYLKYYNIALVNDGLLIPSDDSYDPAMYDGSYDSYTYPDVDWYGEFLKKIAPQQQYKLSLRGGTSSIRYFMFMGATFQDGMYEYADVNPQYNTNPKFSRYNLRSNIDVDVTKSLVVSVDLAMRVENRHVPNVSAGSLFSTLSSLPPNAMPILNRDSTIAGTSSYRDNPYGMISKTGYRDNYQRTLMANVEATQKLDFLLDGLTINGMIGLDGTNYYAMGRSQGYAVYQEFVLPDTTEYIQYGENSDISINTSRFDSDFWYMFSAIGGFSYRQQTESTDFAADLKYQQSKYFQDGNNIAYANQGIFGRATYGIDKTYFVEFGFSYSGSENFNEGNRFGFFPALSGAWIVSNEDTYSDESRFTFMKMRASLGLTGNGQLGVERFPYEQKYYNGSGYIFGDGYSSSDGSYEGRLANSALGWEKSYNLNVGVDLISKSMLNLSVDLFTNYRNNIITTGDNTVPAIVGQDLAYENEGSVLNTGFEATLRYGEQSGDFRYSIQGNLSFAINRILNMNEVDGLPDYQYNKGTSVTALRGLEAVGFFKDEADITASPLHTFETVQPGDVKYKDQNGDNLIDALDEVVIGNTIPQLNLGVVWEMAYKKFDMSAVLSGTFGRKVILNNNSIWVLQNNNKATKIVYDSWQSGVNENGAKYPRLTTLSNKNNYTSSSLWAKRADYLKLVNLEIGYQLESATAARIGVQGIRIFINTYNLFSLDGMIPYNLHPEYANAGVSTYPVMQAFNAGLSLKF